MASPRIRRVLQDIVQKYDNTVSRIKFCETSLHGVKRVKIYKKSLVFLYDKMVYSIFVRECTEAIGEGYKLVDFAV